MIWSALRSSASPMIELLMCPSTT